MSETLELERASEVVDAPAVPNVPAVVDPLRENALADLTSVERGLSQLRAEHGSTSYDITTPHGYKLATARRHAIRLVRFQVPKTVKAQKARLRDIADAVESEGERIVAELRKIEDPHDALITAEDERKAAIAKAKAEAEAAAKAEAARIEAERIQRHRDNIATIRLYLAKAQGLSSDRILRGMDMLSSVSLEGFEEFKAEAEAAMSETAQAMAELYHAAVAREEDAARLAHQRAEQQRIAAEQKAEAERLAAQRAEIERQAAELAAQRAEADRRAQQEEDALVSSILANSRRIEADSPDYIRKASTYFESAAKDWENDPRERVREAVAEGRLYLQSRLADALQRQADQKIRDAVVAQAEEAIRAASPVIDQETGEIILRKAPAEAVDVPAAPLVATPEGDRGPAAAEPLTLSAIGMRLGFAVTQAFMAKIGVQPTAKVKTSVFYDAELWPTIKAALIRHIESIE